MGTNVTRGGNLEIYSTTRRKKKKAVSGGTSTLTQGDTTLLLTEKEPLLEMICDEEEWGSVHNDVASCSESSFKLPRRNDDDSGSYGGTSGSTPMSQRSEGSLRQQQASDREISALRATLEAERVMCEAELETRVLGKLSSVVTNRCVDAGVAPSAGIDSLATLHGGI